MLQTIFPIDVTKTVFIITHSKLIFVYNVIDLWVWCTIWFSKNTQISILQLLFGLNTCRKFISNSLLEKYNSIYECNFGSVKFWILFHTLEHLLIHLSQSYIMTVIWYTPSNIPSLQHCNYACN